MLEKLAALDWATIFGVLFAVSEAIGMLPQAKASGVFQSIFNAIKYVHEKIFPPKPLLK